MSTVPDVPDLTDVLDEGAALEPVPAPWPTLDPAAFEGLAGVVVREISPYTEADPAALLLTFLVMFGNCVGDGPHVVRNAPHPARLNVSLVGATSKSRKGTSRAAIEPVFEIADPAWAPCQIRSGFGSGEALVAAVADPADPDDDPGARDRRLLVSEGEFARILETIRREGNTLSSIVRDAWDGRRLEARKRHEVLTATGSHISVLAHCTVREIQAKLTGTEIANGFGNRFLFAAVRRSQLLAHGAEVPEHLLKNLGQKTAEALAVSRRIGRLDFDRDAADLWTDIYRTLSDDDPPGIVGALTARSDANTLRLAVCYAAIAGSGAITGSHVNAAKAVWDYCAASVRHVWADVETDDPTSGRLLEALRDAGAAGLTGAEQHKALGGHVEAGDLQAARDDLARRGLADTVKESTGGRDRIRTRARTLTLRAKREKREKPPEDLLPSLPSLRSQPREGVRATSGAVGAAKCAVCGKSTGHGPVDREFVCSQCSTEQGVLL